MSPAVHLSDVLPPEALTDSGAGGALAAPAGAAEAVVRPRSTEEVAETLRWAAANGVGVLPLGSGERARRPARVGPYVALVTDRLSGLEIYEPADVTLTAKAGTRLADVAEALGVHRQWLPFDPPHAPGRTLGGLVATGESGPVATGYGELRNHVLGATVVCGDGRVLRLGGRVVKNVAGFDLLRPVVGSRGRLGVITSVCLRAFPVPAEDRLLAYRADDVAALAAVARAVATASVLPASSVVWAPAGPLDAGAALLVRLHGARPTVDADHATLERRVGVGFEIVADGRAAGDAARDHASAGGVILRLSLLPSRLFRGLAAMRERLGDADLVADAYAGSARIAAPDADPDGLRGLRADLEALGGALAVETTGGTLPPGVDDPSGSADLAAVGSRPDEAERAIAERLERVFDPEGVLWPCRT